MSHPTARRRRPETSVRHALPAAAVLAFLVAVPAAHASRWDWSGSVSVDQNHLVQVERADELGMTGAVVEWSLKTTVDVSDKITVNTKLCTSCHGITVDQAYAELRYLPQVNLEVGRINVPFGDYYLRHDPSSDAFQSRPLPYAMGHMLRYQADQFNLGVLPMPYVDHGASVFGDVWIRDRLQVWYTLYGVNGFRSGTSRDFTFKDQVADAGFDDNNQSASWGGRVVLAEGPASAGASYLRGDYDPAADFAYEAWGVDGALYLRGIQLRGEYLERATDVLGETDRETLRKKGFFVSLEVPVRERFAVVGRFDGLLREGPALATVNDDTSGIVRWTAGLNVMPTIDYSLRFQFEYWRFSDFDGVGVFHVGAVTTY
jgi:hypothetical protein